jgi:hypothetical protein
LIACLAGGPRNKGRPDRVLWAAQSRSRLAFVSILRMVFARVTI